MLVECKNCMRFDCKAGKESGAVRCGRFTDTPLTNADKLRETNDNIELAQKIFKFCSNLSENYDFSAAGVLNYLNSIDE